jgi:hypothetical protein
MLPDGSTAAAAAAAASDGSKEGEASSTSSLPAVFVAAVLAACQALDASEAELTKWDQVIFCSFLAFIFPALHP